MPAMRAYLDDFGSITIWMEKNLYLEMKYNKRYSMETLKVKQQC